MTLAVIFHVWVRCLGVARVPHLCCSSLPQRFHKFVGVLHCHYFVRCGVEKPKRHTNSKLREDWVPSATNRNRPSPSLLLVRGPHYTHVYLLHAVYSQTLFTC